MEPNIRVREAARLLGVHWQTIRRWDREGRLRCVRTPGGRRRVPLSEVQRLQGLVGRRTPILYARVSSHDQSGDLQRQKALLLQAYPAGEVHADIRSGLKFDRPGFVKLLDAVFAKRAEKVVVVHEDRLARFGVDLLRRVFAAYGTPIETLMPQELASPHDELARDLIAIITSFSARLYGLRSHKTKRLLSTAREVVTSAD